MSAARQRKLDILIARAKTGELSNKEEAELQGLLEDVDRKSFWLVARLIARQNLPAAPTPRPAQRSRAAATR
jgi:hypothetical protein